MGRPEKPIAADRPERHPLARYLRGLRAAAGLGYREIAGHPVAVRADGSPISAATFQRAAAAKILPPEDVITAFAKACGGDVDKALKLAARAVAWGSAWHAYDTARGLGLPPGERPPRHISPGDIFSLRDLRTAMRYVHLQAGAPSSRALERADLTGYLRHTTLDRVLDPRANPRLPSPELLDAFLAGCDVPKRRWKAWKNAYQRLVDGDERLSARALARETRDQPAIVYSSPCDLIAEAGRREDDYLRFRSLRKSHRNQPDPRGFGLPYDAVEEYPDQWAIEYADQKELNFG
ncbi:helix-turn-helix domain-containing protein [Kitasatospora sp. NPDC056800]|uniref:helix-turn-helix domain-containing protein n=1 Tax=Kitasatospora sp. NPDC056800 TaxID=3345948 RepID=UPI0036BE7A03